MYTYWKLERMLSNQSSRTPSKDEQRPRFRMQLASRKSRQQLLMGLDFLHFTRESSFIVTDKLILSISELCIYVFTVLPALTRFHGPKTLYMAQYELTDLIRPKNQMSYHDLGQGFS